MAMFQKTTMRVPAEAALLPIATQMESDLGVLMDPAIQGAVAAVAIPALQWTFLIL
jgi:hypothetical protein